MAIVLREVVRSKCAPWDCSIFDLEGRWAPVTKVSRCWKLVASHWPQVIRRCGITRKGLLLISLLLIYQAEQGLTGEEAAQILVNKRVMTIPEFVGHGGGMGGDEQIIQIPQG